MSVPKDTGTADTPPEPSSIGTCDLIAPGLGSSEVRTKRSGPLRSSSHSGERFRGRQGEKTSSASIQECTVASGVLPLPLALLGVCRRVTLGSGCVRMRAKSPLYASPEILSEPRGLVSPKGSRCVGVSTVSGPEGLGTIDTPLPLALSGVWWCSTPRCGSETRETALPEDLAASRALIKVRISSNMMV